MESDLFNSDPSENVFVNLNLLGYDQAEKWENL